MFILSYEFMLAFFAFFCVYWACKKSIKTQNILLIIAGFLYLASWDNWTGKFVLSLLVMWQVTQFSALVINYTQNRLYKKITLIIALVVLVGHLCFFKYSNFFIDEYNYRIASEGGLQPLDIIVPLGLSFYTFQAISYIVDVFKDKMQPLPSHQSLAFLSFVPTITAGPIYRAQAAAVEWSETEEKVTSQSSTGQYKEYSEHVPRQRQILSPYLVVALVCLALTKKMIFASWLQEIWVNPVFANPLQFNPIEVLLGIYAYAFQLFFDFSAYTELAIAFGLLLGFKLPENFNRPYLATDLREFWNRWHITLSTWIRDYLYIPFGGNRGSFVRVQANLIAAFVLSGIWHGAGWNFFIWGLIHALGMVWLNAMKHFGNKGWLAKKCKPLAIFLTFNYVCFGWIFFNTQTLDQALIMLASLVTFNEQEITLPVLVTSVAMLIGYITYAYLGDIRAFIVSLLKKTPWWLLSVIITVYVLMIFIVSPEGLPGFIYANF